MGRRGFLAVSGAGAAASLLAGARPAQALQGMPLRQSRAVSDDLAKMTLLVGPAGEDLKLQYLRILIDEGLPKATRPKRIVVVGAGPAGLVAARLLKAAGHRVTIVEANGNRVGGRVKTFRGVFADKALYAEAGAMRLPDSHPLVLALADKLGLRRRPFYLSDVLPGSRPGATPSVVYRSWTGHEWSNGPRRGFRAPKAGGRTLIQVNGKRVTRAEYAKNPGPVNASFGGVRIPTSTRAALDAALAPLHVPADKPIAEQIRGWTRVYRDFDDHSMHRYLVEKGWELPRIQAVGTLDNLTSRLHYSIIPAVVDHALIGPSTQFWELQGGTASLTDALAKELKGDIHQGRRMTRITQSDDGVHVHTTAESGTEDSDGAPTDPVKVFDADYVIVTIPATAARFCTFEPALSYAKRRAITELHYDSATKVLLEFKTRFWEQGANGFVGGGCVSDLPNRFTYFPSHVDGDSRGGVVLASYTWSDDAMRWDSLTESERVHFALQGMAAMFGDQVYKQFTGHGISQSWTRARYALGEAAIITPGQLHEHHPATRTPEGRIHFAGDHTSLKPAWIEGALESAVRAALEVHRR
ncbi:flavin monoamine oxidase family protein [Spirillospora sp. NPDC048911]|uniref:flavin monoamine oxidase family protein n=1 Tax=Spirillospora sp. NPDC048911 TaxID=3364527 RepID=UPI003724641A